METATISIPSKHHLIGDKKSNVKKKTRNYKDFKSRNVPYQEANFLEDRIAALVNASTSISVKSPKSAIYLLIKHLLKKGENIVTVNSIGLFRNDIIREKSGIEVRLTDDETLSTFKSSIDEKTKLIFLESTGLENTIIPDFQKILAYAKTKNIPVAVYNTIGAVGTIFNPIILGAQYSIEDYSTFSENKEFPKTVLIENFNVPNPFVDALKSEKLQKKNFLKLPDNFFANIDQLEKIAIKSKQQSLSTNLTAKWLKDVKHIQYVEYVGFPNHKNHFHALKYYSGGFGKIFSFSLWANYRSFDFFLDSLIPKSKGLFKIISVNYELKKVNLEIIEEDSQKIIDHFERAFHLLNNYLGQDYFLYENLYDNQDVVGY